MAQPLPDNSITKYDLNYMFYLDFLDKNFPKEGTECLDFGCAFGKFVRFANENGYHFRGADNYYDSTGLKDLETIQEDLKKNIYIIDATGKIPFADKTFDFVCSEQVFEHVRNMDKVISELARIIKDNGKMVHHFPIKYSIYEPHIGIPFFHWFSTGSMVRKPWTRFWYILGFGLNKDKTESFNEWYKWKQEFVDNHCFYRTRKEIIAVCNNYGLEVIELGKEKVLFHTERMQGIIPKVAYLAVGIFPRALTSFIMGIIKNAVLEIKKSP